MLQTLTRPKARESQQREARGYLFPLPYTGGEARVRRIPMAKLASITGIPAEMQNTVLEVFRDFQNGKSFVVHTWGDMARNQDRQEEIADALCIAGFMEPRLVATLAEADAANADNVLWVKEVHITDRITYLFSVMQPESEAAKAMEPFPEDGAQGIGPDEGLPPAAPSVESVATAPGDELQPIGLP